MKYADMKNIFRKRLNSEKQHCYLKKNSGQVLREFYSKRKILFLDCISVRHITQFIIFIYQLRAILISMELVYFYRQITYTTKHKHQYKNIVSLNLPAYVQILKIVLQQQKAAQNELLQISPKVSEIYMYTTFINESYSK